MRRPLEDWHTLAVEQCLKEIERVLPWLDLSERIAVERALEQLVREVTA